MIRFETSSSYWVNSEFKILHLRAQLLNLLTLQQRGRLHPLPTQSILSFEGERVKKRVEKYDQLLEKRKKKHRGLVSYGETRKEPTTYQDALRGGDSVKWKEAMEDEFSSLKKNQTWTLTKLPAGKNVVGCKWVLKLKYKPDSFLDRYKARLVAKGYSQVYGIDFSETFLLGDIFTVVKMTSIRVLMAPAAQNNVELHQMDVKTALLNGLLDEEVYMALPEE